MSLPTEVLDHILQQLSDDKHTLSRCMRVSSTINSIVAPLLYQSIKLTGSAGVLDNTTASYRKTNADYANIPLRISQTKTHNLTLVKDVDYEHHAKSYCSEHWRSAKLLVSRMRIMIDTLEPRLDQRWSPCACIHRIKPDKLILEIESTSAPHHWIKTSNKTIILSNDSESVFTWDRHRITEFFKILPRRQLVLVFWSLPPTISSDTPWTMSTWRLFQDNMLATAIDSTAAESVVLVNIESIIANHLDPGGDPSLSCNIARQDTENKRDEMLERYLRTSPEEIGEALCKTVQEARKTTFTFVSMKEYLAEYDWKGEFDEEKIKPWLEINEQAGKLATFEKAGRTGQKQ